MGAFSEPSIPPLPGLDAFQGKVFHSARWDHHHDLGGRNVAVIGTGASAIQFVPEIQPQVGKLLLFQRTPAWVVPRYEHLLGPATRSLYRRLPVLQKLARGIIYARREIFVLAFRHPQLMRIVEAFALRYLKRCIADPDLRAKLTPSFRMGCKRILLSNDDGCRAPGLRVLADTLRPHCELTVVAPDRNRSGASNSLTLLNPVRATRHEDGVVCVDGTPTDCVHLALTGLMQQEPDIVVSGINAGPNLGDDVLYSGTVAAAMEGRHLACQPSRCRRGVKPQRTDGRPRGRS
jgi:hypothetical protein